MMRKAKIIAYKCQYKFVLFVKNKNVQLFN